MNIQTVQLSRPSEQLTKVIVFFGIGKFWTFDTKNWDKKDLYQSKQPCVYSCGWDDPAEQCYSFFSCSVEDIMLVTKVGYDGTVLTKECFVKGMENVTLHSIKHFSQNDLFILQFSSYDSADEDDYLKLLEPLMNVPSLDKLDDAFSEVIELNNVNLLDVRVVLSTGALTNGKVIFHDAYKGGGICSCVFVLFFYGRR